MNRMPETAEAYAATATGEALMRPPAADDARQLVLKCRPSLLMALPHFVVALGIAAAAWWLTSSPLPRTWLMTGIVQPMKLTVTATQLAGWLHIAALVLAAVAGLWVLGRIAWLKSRRFELNLQQIVFEHGLLARSCELMELYRVRDVQVIMPLYLRPFGIGHCILITSDPTTPILPLLGVRHPARLAQTIRDMYHQAMHRAGVVNVM